MLPLSPPTTPPPRGQSSEAKKSMDMDEPKSHNPDHARMQTSPLSSPASTCSYASALTTAGSQSPRSTCSSIDWEDMFAFTSIAEDHKNDSSNSEGKDCWNEPSPVLRRNMAQKEPSEQNAVYSGDVNDMGMGQSNSSNPNLMAVHSISHSGPSSTTVAGSVNSSAIWGGTTSQKTNTNDSSTDMWNGFLSTMNPDGESQSDIYKPWSIEIPLGIMLSPELRPFQSDANDNEVSPASPMTPLTQPASSSSPNSSDCSIRSTETMYTPSPPTPAEDVAEPEIPDEVIDAIIRNYSSKTPAPNLQADHEYIRTFAEKHGLSFEEAFLNIYYAAEFQKLSVSLMKDAMYNLNLYEKELNKTESTQSDQELLEANGNNTCTKSGGQREFSKTGRRAPPGFQPFPQHIGHWHPPGTPSPPPRVTNRGPPPSYQAQQASNNGRYQSWGRAGPPNQFGQYSRYQQFIERQGQMEGSGRGPRGREQQEQGWQPADRKGQMEGSGRGPRGRDQPEQGWHPGQKYCIHCRDSGRPREVYFSHDLYDRKAKTVSCRFLLRENGMSAQ